MIITPAEIRKLNKDTIWDKLEELNLYTEEKKFYVVRMMLLKHVQVHCEHPDKRNLYDMKSTLCPECDTLWDYDHDTDELVCHNCGNRTDIESGGAMDDMDTYLWLTACISCYKCDFQGHPEVLSKDEDPFKVIEEVVGGW